jgi:hypothetical protein
MCGGFVGDILDGIGDIIEDVGDFVGDTVEAVIDNPLGVLVNVGLMSMGVPPIYAGAIAGGVNAAVNDGNILEGALLGGATAGAGGAAGSWAASSGLSTTAQAAAMGAAAGATGAVLTGQGGSGIIRGAIGGGVMGGALGYIQSNNGEITYTYDDGSTLTRMADGTYTSTPSNTIPAPVVDRSTYSTPEGTVNLSSSRAYDTGAAPGTVWTGPGGAEIVLNDGKVLPLDVYKAAIDSGNTIYVDGVAIDPSFQTVAQNQGNFNNQSNIVNEFRTSGTALATVEEINTGRAFYNPRAQAWETNTISDLNTSSVPMDIQSTGISDSSPGTIYNGPNGPEVVLDSGKTVRLSDYQDAIDSGRLISVDGSMQTQYKVETTGVYKTEGMQGAGTPPEGYKVATVEDIFGPDDSRNASNPFKTGTYLDREQGTWFTPTETPVLTPVAPEPIVPTEPSQPMAPTAPISTYNPNGQTTVFDDGTWLTIMPDGSTSGIDTMGQSFARGPGTVSTPGAGAGAGQTVIYDDGSSITINPNGSITTTDTDGTTSTRNPVGGSGGGTGGTGLPSPDYDFPSTVGTGDTGGTGGTGGPGTGGPVNPSDIPEIVIVDDRPTVLPSPDDDFPPTVGPVAPPDDTVLPSPDEDFPPTVTDPTTPTPTLPIVPIVPPTTPVTPPPSGPGYTVTWGTPSPLQTNFGLNPGFIQPVAQYQTTSPVQSQYYWGAAPFQQGPTFNPQLAAQGIGAPQIPWGLQQMYQQLTPAQTAALVQQQSYLSQLPGAQVAGPVAPT